MPLSGICCLLAMALLLSNREALAHAGADAPKVSFVMAGGEQVTLGSLRGKIVIVTYWARWCAPCKPQLAKIDRLYRRLKSSGLVVIAVDADGVEPRHRFVGLSPARSFPVSRRVIGKGLPLDGVPTTYLLDCSGSISRKWTGDWNERPFVRDVEALLKSDKVCNAA